MARSKHIVFTNETVHKDVEHNKVLQDEEKDTSTYPVDVAAKLEVPRQLSWRESLVLPIDVILPSPSSPGDPREWADRTKYEYSTCIHCPCQNRRRRRSSGDSQSSRRSLKSRNKVQDQGQVRGDLDLRLKWSDLEPSPKQVELKGSQPITPPRRPSRLQVPAVDGRKQSTKDPCCFSCTQKSEDDVDGPGSQGRRRDGSRDTRRKSSFTGPILDAFIKLIFLKILFLDIGISLGDLVMDFYQGFNLIFRDLGSVSFIYGICLVGACWIPCIAVPLHLGLGAYKDIFRKRGFLETMVLVLLYLTFFPLIPTICYVCLLLTPRNSREQRRVYREVERKAHEIKSITASVEAPIQMTIVLYLMLRGILTLPWNEPLSSSCIEDKLGRVACLPSIPLLSIMFSILSIIKAMFDLNIHPLMANRECGMELMKESLLLFLRYLPFSVANILFRICSYAFILVYLDYWSSIPAVLLLLCNLIIFGFSFTRLIRSYTSTRSPNTPDVELRLEDFSEREQTVSPREEADRRPPIGWNSLVTDTSPEAEWRSSEPSRRPESGWNSEVFKDNIKTFSTADFVKRKDPESGRAAETEGSPKPFKCQETELNKNIFVFSEVTPTAEAAGKEEDKPRKPSGRSAFNRYLSHISSVRSEQDRLPEGINEGNTSIFFNSVSGLFFPSCHSHIKPFRSSRAPPPPLADSDIDLQLLVNWQNHILRRQVYIFNSLLLLVILAVWILVTFTPFYYTSNILDPFWFNVTFSILVSLWLVTLVLACELKSPLQRWFPTLCGDTAKVQEGPARHGSAKEKEVRHGSTKDTLDGSLSALAEERRRNSMVRRVAVCFLLSLLLAIPPLIALAGYQHGSMAQPYIFLMQEAAGGSEAQVELGILAAFPLIDSSNTKILVGSIETSCSVEDLSDLAGKILVVNTSRPLCRILLEKENFFNLTASTGAAGLIILDSTPKHKWRVSSPYATQFKHNYENMSTPVWMVREPDWQKFDKFLQRTGNKISVMYEDSISSLDQLFACSRRSQLNLEGYIEDGTCSGGKYLTSNGSVIENICVQGECFQYGNRCISPVFSRFKDLTRRVECKAGDLNGVDLQFKFREKLLDKESNLALPNARGEGNYCCRGPQYNSTFLEVYQGQTCFTSWSEVDLKARSCAWTHWTTSNCTQKGTNVMRYCLVQSACIIKEYYITRGCSQEMVNHCQTNNNKCTPT